MSSELHGAHSSRYLSRLAALKEYAYMKALYEVSSSTRYYSNEQNEGRSSKLRTNNEVLANSKKHKKP